MSVNMRVGEVFRAASVESNHSIPLLGSAGRDMRLDQLPFRAPLNFSASPRLIDGALNAQSLKPAAQNEDHSGRAVLVASYAPGLKPEGDEKPYIRVSNATHAWKPKEILVVNELFNRYQKLNDEAAAIELLDALQALGIVDVRGAITPAGEKKLNAMRDTGFLPKVKLGVTPVALTENGTSFKQPLFLVLEIISNQVKHDPEWAYSAINPEQRKELETNIAEAIRQSGHAELYSDWAARIPLPAAIRRLGQ